MEVGFFYHRSRFKFYYYDLLLELGFSGVNLLGEVEVEFNPN
jgi:hypothetical protein